MPTASRSTSGGDSDEEVLSQYQSNGKSSEDRHSAESDEEHRYASDILRDFELSPRKRQKVFHMARGMDEVEEILRPDAEVCLLYLRRLVRWDAEIDIV